MEIYNSPRLKVWTKGAHLVWETKLEPVEGSAGGIIAFSKWARYYGIHEEAIAEIQAGFNDLLARRYPVEPVLPVGAVYKALMPLSGTRKRRRGVRASVVYDSERVRIGLTGRGTVIYHLRSPKLSSPRVLRASDATPSYFAGEEAAVQSLRALFTRLASSAYRDQFEA